ncbi:hypothetical protein GCM10009839_94300 [Catenulispora yoronensis]|uniref:Uncharacterized protein n=1 Tax=Catenulispora yoronensis TaxID=450799 RepID=A0ABN2VPY0_9ACTN
MLSVDAQVGGGWGLVWVVHAGEAGEFSCGLAGVEALYVAACADCEGSCHVDFEKWDVFCGVAATDSVAADRIGRYYGDQRYRTVEGGGFRETADAVDVGFPVRASEAEVGGDGAAEGVAVEDFDVVAVGSEAEGEG